MWSLDENDPWELSVLYRMVPIQFRPYPGFTERPLPAESSVERSTAAPVVLSSSYKRARKSQRLKPFTTVPAAGKERYTTVFFALNVTDFVRFLQGADEDRSFLGPFMRPGCRVLRMFFPACLLAAVCALLHCVLQTHSFLFDDRSFPGRTSRTLRDATVLPTPLRPVPLT